MPPSIAHLLVQTATIKRIVRTPTGKGGHAEELRPVKTSEPCRLGGAKLTQYVAEDGKLVADVRRDAWFLPALDLRIRDVVVVDGRSHIVNSTDLQADGVYRKAILNEEQA